MNVPVHTRTPRRKKKRSIVTSSRSLIDLFYSKKINFTLYGVLFSDH